MNIVLYRRKLSNFLEKLEWICIKRYSFEYAFTAIRDSKVDVKF